MVIRGRSEEPEEEEKLGSLRREKGLALMTTMTVEEADAQEVSAETSNGGGPGVRRCY
jgi:hypothetical protein